VSFTFRCALIFVDTYAHTLLLEVNFNFSRSYPTFAYTGKHLASYSQKLSILSKQSKLIPKELRYQEKIHTIICNDKRKEKSCKFSPIFFLLKNMQYEKKKTSYARQDQT
jgi:hypothetical protein